MKLQCHYWKPSTDRLQHLTSLLRETQALSQVSPLSNPWAHLYSR